MCGGKMSQNVNGIDYKISLANIVVQGTTVPKEIVVLI